MPLATQRENAYFGPMKLAEFSQLPEDGQATIVWQDGTFVTYRDMGRVTIVLYRLLHFYVEVYYQNENNKVLKFLPFSSKKRLELYYQVNLN